MYNNSLVLESPIANFPLVLWNLKWNLNLISKLFQVRINRETMTISPRRTDCWQWMVQSWFKDILCLCCPLYFNRKRIKRAATRLQTPNHHWSFMCCLCIYRYPHLVRCFQMESFCQEFFATSQQQSRWKWKCNASGNDFSKGRLQIAGDQSKGAEIFLAGEDTIEWSE